MSPRMWKALMVLGVFGFLFTTLMVGVAASMVLGGGLSNNTADENARMGRDMGICSIFVLAPSAILFLIGWNGRTRHIRLKTVSDYLRGYRRMKISVLALKIGSTEPEAERLALMCIEENMIKGWIDRSTSEFFTEEGMARSDNEWKCPNCGAFNESVYLSGETIRCNYCNVIRGGWDRDDFGESKGLDTKVVQDSLCSNCGKPLIFISEYQRWYCYRCEEYR